MLITLKIQLVFHYDDLQCVIEKLNLLVYRPIYAIPRIGIKLFSVGVVILDLLKSFVNLFHCRSNIQNKK